LALVVLLASVAAVTAQVAEAAALGATVAIMWILGIGAIPVWICSLTYGIIGIEVGRTWPNPHCCCYRSSHSGGDGGSACLGCLPIFNTCVVLLVIQSIYLLVDLLIIVVFYIWWFNIIGLIVDLAAVGVLIAAIVLLRQGYSRDGNPKPVGTTTVTIVHATPVMGVPQNIQMAKPGFQGQQNAIP